MQKMCRTCKEAHNLHYFSTMGTSPCLAQVSKFLFIILPWLALSPHSSKVMGLNSYRGLSVCRLHVLSPGFLAFSQNPKTRNGYAELSTGLESTLSFKYGHCWLQN